MEKLHGLLGRWGFGYTSKRLCLGGGNGIMHEKKKSEDIGEETILFGGLLFGGFVCLGVGYILWRVYEWALEAVSYTHLTLPPKA